MNLMNFLSYCICWGKKVCFGRIFTASSWAFRVRSILAGEKYRYDAQDLQIAPDLKPSNSMTAKKKGHIIFI